YLVGYYVSELKLDEDEILNYLRARLPEYMVPSILVYLKELPLTINGKLDRRALPDPEFGSKDNYVAPRNEIEKKVCQIWSEVLGLSEDKVGIRDDFFRLGGDSILAIRIVSKLNKEFDSQIAVKDLFELREIYRLVDIIKSNKTSKKSELYTPFSFVNMEDYKKVLPNINLVEDIYPASYLQMGMLLESTLNNQGTYHDVFSYYIKSNFDKNKFLSIWKNLTNRHELLRACFVLNNDNGWNVVIYKEIEIAYEIFINQTTEELIISERLNNFDYSIPGLFKLIINDLGSSFDLIFSFHHAITDGWSVASLINEFVQCYINDQPIEPKLSIRYGEFVKNELAAIRNQTNIDFWKGYLNDLNITKVHWKFDTEISKNSLYSSSFSLSNEEVSLVHKIAKELRVSVDSIFLLAYLKTLSYFTDNSDITVGVVVNNRLEKEEGDKIFGLFLNTIPFRLKLNKKKNCLDELLEVFNAKVKLQHYKHLPYGYIRSLFKQDLYDFAFNFMHFHIINDSLSHLDYFTGYQRTNIPFILNVSQHKNTNFYLTINVHDDYISQDYLDYFVLYYQKCLMNVLQDNDVGVSLIRQDYNKLIKIWNQVDKNYPGDRTIHQLFEEQVEESPDSIAVVYEEIRLTYRELNERANSLAHYLIGTYEIKPDTLVVLCLDRSEHMLIGILAILKAGGAYVPIDPSYPDERIKYILKDTGTKVVLTSEIYKQRLEDIRDRILTNRFNTKSNYLTKIVEIDGYKLQEELSLKLGTNLNTDVTSDNLTYVIYTSGTTGNPKGVMIEHRVCVARVLYMINKNEMSYEDKLLFKTNFIFDVSFSDIFCTLISGGELYITHEVFNIDEIKDKLSTYNISICHFVPSQLYAIKQDSDFSNFNKLNKLMFSGESLDIRMQIHFKVKKKI
ncbi:MAG: hypothetical protein EB000_01115, partial [Alphaproteobacteria bacterium]|nr:hypothetical protein [Alphaproteobacteria bacterium]